MVLLQLFHEIILCESSVEFINFLSLSCFLRRSAVEVCHGMTLLDMIVNSIEVSDSVFGSFCLIFCCGLNISSCFNCLQSLNSNYGCNIPLLLMNTIKTNDDTVKVSFVFHSYVCGYYQNLLIGTPCNLGFGEISQVKHCDAEIIRWTDQ